MAATDVKIEATDTRQALDMTCASAFTQSKTLFLLLQGLE
jgi:hypothetical protein